MSGGEGSRYENLVFHKRPLMNPTPTPTPPPPPKNIEIKNLFTCLPELSPVGNENNNKK